MKSIKQWLKRFEDVWPALLFFIITDAAGFVVLFLQSFGSKAAACLWALACLAMGSVIGFLFGIPRVLQHDTAAAAIAAAGTAPPPDDKQASAAPAIAPKPSVQYRLQINTNLEQISDWLTKIIVGLGLIELRRFPELMNRASSFIAEGLGSGLGTRPFAGALILYFVGMGFFGGYLFTRLYLAGAFRRADEAATGTAIVAENNEKMEISSEDFSIQVWGHIKDLQKQVLDLQKPLPVGGMEVPAAADDVRTQKVRLILWVDDFPSNNTLIIQYLREQQIEVVTALTTEEGLNQLRLRRFDCVISDMGRRNEPGGSRAGIELIKAVKKEFPDIPIAIYCSAPAAVKYRSEALGEGAVEITPSQTDLLKALQLYND